MKTSLQFAGLFFIFTCVLLICLDMETQTQRESELEEATSLSMRNVLKASTYAPMYEMNQQDMSSEFLRHFAENINGDGDFTITIQEADRLGILDVSIAEHFTHNNGVANQRELHRIMFVEQYLP